MVIKKIFRIVVERYRTIPFLRKTVHSATVVAGVIDFQESMLIAMNQSMPLHHRMLAGVKGGCCSAALVSSYFARVVPDPKVAAVFKVCCGFATLGYLTTGGEVSIILSIFASSNTTTTIK